MQQIVNFFQIFHFLIKMLRIGNRYWFEKFNGAGAKPPKPLNSNQKPLGETFSERRKPAYL